MITIRPASMQDFDAIYMMAREQAARYDRLKIDHDKMKASIINAISTKAHCVLVAESDGEVVGVLAGLTTQNAWAQRRACSIALWVCSVPWGMRRLMEEFKIWVKPRRGIRVSGMSPDLECHPSVWRVAERLGFEHIGGAYLLYN